MVALAAGGSEAVYFLLLLGRDQGNVAICMQEFGHEDNKHLMTGHKGNSEFCFPES